MFFELARNSSHLLGTPRFRKGDMRSFRTFGLTKAATWSLAVSWTSTNHSRIQISYLLTVRLPIRRTRWYTFKASIFPLLRPVTQSPVEACWPLIRICPKFAFGNIELAMKTRFLFFHKLPEIPFCLCLARSVNSPFSVIIIRWRRPSRLHICFVPSILVDYEFFVGY